MNLETMSRRLFDAPEELVAAENKPTVPPSGHLTVLLLPCAAP